MSALTDCYAKYQGTAVLVPGGGAGNNGQCAQWADTVLHEVYGRSYVYTPAAKDWWYNADALGLTPFFSKVDPGGPIQVGDFVIYDPLSATDPQGHIDVCSRVGTSSDFWAYDSNWDATNFHDAQGFPTLHEVHHNDSLNQKIIGYLRLTGGSMAERTYNAGDAGDIAPLIGYNLSSMTGKVDWHDAWYTAIRPVLVELNAKIATLEATAPDPSLVALGNALKTYLK